jgi:hypothetical protein
MGRHGGPDHTTALPSAAAGFEQGLLRILAAVLVGVGMPYLLGGPASATSLVAMASIEPFPELGGMRGWGAVLTAAGVILATGQRTAGHGLATLVLLVWAGCSLVTLLDGTATGASGPVTLGGWAIVHGWCLYSHRREARRA